MRGKRRVLEGIFSAWFRSADGNEGDKQGVHIVKRQG
jgi:hypothetical protein